MNGNPVVVAPGQPGRKNEAYTWPLVAEGKRPPRMARLLARGLELDLTSTGDRDAANELLREAWRIVHRAVLEQGYPDGADRGHIGVGGFDVDRGKLHEGHSNRYCAVA